MAKAYKVLGVKKLPIAELTSLSNFKKKRLDDVNFRDYWNNHSSLLTPYSIDYKRRCVTFVETPVTTKLLKSQPFLYQAQRDYASRLFLVPFNEVLALEPVKKVPSSQEINLVFLHSTGRCGSTLLCKMLECIDEIATISEPDFYSQWFMLEQRYGARLDNSIPDIMAKLTDLLIHELEESPAEKTTVIKLRGICINVADKINQALPESKSIFLYRNAYDTINSFLGMVLKHPLAIRIKNLGLDKLSIHWLGKLPGVESKLNAFAPLRADDRFKRLPASGGGAVMALSWLSKMDMALNLMVKKPGFFVCSIRYKDLLENAQLLVQNLSAYLEVKQPDEEIKCKMQKTLESNSQEGSEMESDGVYRLNDFDLEMIDYVLQQHDEICQSDYILPNTIELTTEIISDKALAAHT